MREKKILRMLEFETIFSREENQERGRGVARGMKAFFFLFGYLVFLDIPCVIGGSFFLSLLVNLFFFPFGYLVFGGTSGASPLYINFIFFFHFYYDYFYFCFIINELGLMLVFGPWGPLHLFLYQHPCPSIFAPLSCFFIYFS